MVSMPDISSSDDARKYASRGTKLREFAIETILFLSLTIGFACALGLTKPRSIADLLGTVLAGLSLPYFLVFLPSRLALSRASAFRFNRARMRPQLTEQERAPILVSKAQEEQDRSHRVTARSPLHEESREMRRRREIVTRLLEQFAERRTGTSFHAQSELDYPVEEAKRALLEEARVEAANPRPDEQDLQALIGAMCDLAHTVPDEVFEKIEVELALGGRMATGDRAAQKLFQEFMKQNRKLLYDQGAAADRAFAWAREITAAIAVQRLCWPHRRQASELSTKS